MIVGDECHAECPVTAYATISSPICEPPLFMNLSSITQYPILCCSKANLVPIQQHKYEYNVHFLQLYILTKQSCMSAAVTLIYNKHHNNNNWLEQKSKAVPEWFSVMLFFCYAQHN